MNRVGTSVAGGPSWKTKRCRRVGDTVKKSTSPRAAALMVILIERKGVVLEGIQGMSTGVVMETEGLGMLVAEGEITAMIMMMRAETHVRDSDGMHSIAVGMSMITAGARKTGTLPIGMLMLKGQGMQIRTAAETRPIITDAEISSLTCGSLFAFA